MGVAGGHQWKLLNSSKDQERYLGRGWEWKILSLTCGWLAFIACVDYRVWCGRV